MQKIIILVFLCIIMAVGGAPQYGNNDFRSGNELQEHFFGKSSQVIGHFDEPQFTQNNEEEEPRKIHKFISIHIAPPEEPQERPKPIKIPQIREKNYQIVFIKAPSPSSVQDEIQLPPHPETKTLVYVLLKKQSVEDIKIRGPPPTQKPSPPQVLFIRYKGGGPPQNVVNEEDNEDDDE